MLYELRTYFMHPGRLGAIHERFREHTLALFRRHGIKVIDFWQEADGEELICYLCAFSDRKARDEAFDAFGKDPDWQRTREESEKDGPIVAKIESLFLTRVPYSPAEKE